MLTHPSGAAASAEHASESELRQSPVFTSSEPSSATLEVPTVTVDSPQASTSRLSPINRWRLDERLGSRQSPILTRNNSLASELGVSYYIFAWASCDITFEQGGFEEWRCDQAFQFDIPRLTDDPWEAGYKIAREHDKEMCDAWREGVDKLLIFVSVF